MSVIDPKLVENPSARRPYRSPNLATKRVLVANLFVTSPGNPGGPGGAFHPGRPPVPPRGA